MLYGELYVGMVFPCVKWLYIGELWLVKLYVGLYGRLLLGVLGCIVE